MANGTWKIARRSNTQLPLVIVLVLAVVLVLLGKAQAGLFDRARTQLTDWMAPVLQDLHAPVRAFNRWTGSIDDLFSVYGENLALKEENARLRQWRSRAVVMESRVVRLQRLLHAVPDPVVDSRLARVIGRASRPFLQTMILDAGKTAGIAAGEPVVDARGMIGRIFLAGARTSWVILLTDVNSRVPVTVVPAAAGQPNRQAILAGDSSPMPLLDALPEMVSLHAGDQVVSSGDGGLMPPGLPIGTVVTTRTGYRVALLADAGASEDVEILSFHQPPETMPSAAKTPLPAVAAGLPPAAAPVPGPPEPVPALSTPFSSAPTPPAQHGRAVAAAQPAGRRVVTPLAAGPVKAAVPPTAPAPVQAGSRAASGQALPADAGQDD